MGLTGQPRSDFDTSTSTTGPAGNHPRPPAAYARPGDPPHGTPLSMGKANGRMHHHDKHAATKDGHRPDDPHAVTNPLTNQWKAERVRFQDTDPHGEPDWKQQQLDSLMNNQVAIQAVLDEPNIQREGHEVFDENVNYGQRVSAFGKVERDASEEHGYPLEGDEAVDVIEGEEDQAFAKKAIYGQDMPPPPPAPPRQSRSSEEAQVEAHTPGYGPDEKFWRKGEQQKDTDDARKWQEGKKFDRKMEEKTGRSSPPRPFPESRFTPDGETKIPAPPRQDGRPHQRTPSDADRAKAGPPPPPPSKHVPSRPPPQPPR